MAESRNRATISRAALELAGIVFAVLLALWLESLRDDAELQARADEAVSRIRIEVESNRREMLRAIAINGENRKGIRNILAATEQGEAPFDFQQISKYLAISSASLSDSAWTSAKMTGMIARVPADTISRMARLYDTQAYYREYARFFTQQYTDLTTEMQKGPEAEKAALKFVQHMSILDSIGEQLAEDFDQFLAFKSSKPGT